MNRQYLRLDGPSSGKEERNLVDILSVKLESFDQGKVLHKQMAVFAGTVWPDKNRSQ